MTSEEMNIANHGDVSAQLHLSRKEAARYLLDTYGAAVAVSATTLAKLASIGGGPEFRRFGRRVGYTHQALHAFVQKRASLPLISTSTPDYRAQEHASAPFAAAATVATSAPSLA